MALALRNNARVSLMHVVHSHTIDQDRALRDPAEATLKASREVFTAQGCETDKR